MDIDRKPGESLIDYERRKQTTQNQAARTESRRIATLQMPLVKDALATIQNEVERMLSDVVGCPTSQYGSVSGGAGATVTVSASTANGDKFSVSLTVFALPPPEKSRDPEADNFAYMLQAEGTYTPASTQNFGRTAPMRQGIQRDRFDVPILGAAHPRVDIDTLRQNLLRIVGLR